MGGKFPADPAGLFTKAGIRPEMTLRDWFAGQALAGTFSYASARIREGMDRDYLPEEWAARIAYGVADAMLAERAKGQG